MPRSPIPIPGSARMLPTLLWMAAVCCILLSTPLASAADTDGAARFSGGSGSGSGSGRTEVSRLTIEGIRFEGMERTREQTAMAVLDLAIGDRITSGDVQSAADRLSRSHLFSAATVRVLPGSRRGGIELVFTVEETRPHFRFGVGYEDLGGWFLEPVQLNLDNLTGRGEEFDIAFRLGARSAGARLDWRMSGTTDRERYWGLGLHSEALTRLYFWEGAEVAHKVERSTLEGGGALPLGRGVALRVLVGSETVSPDSTAELHANAPDGRRAGQDLANDELPLPIRDSLERRTRVRVGSELVLDRRMGAGLRRRGLWGRAGYSLTVDEEASPIHSGELDVRAYLPLDPAQMAGRVAFETVSASAPFYDRPYLGGLYSVRGYPSHALSPAVGDLRLVTASLELRTAWWGSASDPRVVGLAFVDAGWASGILDEPEPAFGVGYGWRVRVPWLGRIGLDIGIPLNDAPIDEAFHPNLSLGWTY